MNGADRQAVATKIAKMMAAKEMAVRDKGAVADSLAARTAGPRPWLKKPEIGKSLAYKVFQENFEGYVSSFEKPDRSPPSSSPTDMLVQELQKQLQVSHTLSLQLDHLRGLVGRLRKFYHDCEGVFEVLNEEEGRELENLLAMLDATAQVYEIAPNSTYQWTEGDPRPTKKDGSMRKNEFLDNLQRI